MTFEQQVVEKIQELARDYELRLLEFHIEHFFHNGTVRFTINGIGLPPPIAGQDRVHGYINPAGRRDVETPAPLQLEHNTDQDSD
jgi:hypothetical protein